jgi:2-polyprenyl-3-methyl-5-hydroxy-6-metoxy-1,4-benzoquinol methylase
MENRTVEQPTIKDALIEKMTELQELVRKVPQLADAEFNDVAAAWQGLVDTLKDAVYDLNPRNKFTRADFEYGWGAQSAQFMIDCIPEFHAILKQYYRRKDELKLLDVGAGSGAGSNIITLLHSDHYIYSKIHVDAVDNTPVRQRWVKTMYPKINYRVADLFDLPDKQWDFVFCNAVIEHVSEPRKFCEHLVRVCRGFAFVLAPYKETNRIPSHVNTLDESLFKGFKMASFRVFASMAWHPGIPEDKCFLAVIDCRKRCHPLRSTAKERIEKY